MTENHNQWAFCLIISQCPSSKLARNEPMINHSIMYYNTYLHILDYKECLIKARLPIESLCLEI